MVHALYILVAALPLNVALQGDTASTDPFTMAKWELNAALILSLNFSLFFHPAV